MNTPDSAENPESPVNPENLVWDEFNQPVSKKFNDIYFSKENGLKETEYVFLESNDLRRRFSELTAHGVFRIAETGFGTALNFLATWQLWDQNIKHNSILEFISIEKYPLSKKEIQKALQAWPELTPYAEQLVACYPPQPWTGPQRIEFIGKHRSNIKLTIYFCDIKDALRQLSPCPANASASLRVRSGFGQSQAKIHAWFLDGFAPAKNPEMWSDDLYTHMAINSTEGTTFATFTSAGRVRRGLSASGFSCKKKAGFGRKREMLFGMVNESENAQATSFEEQTETRIQGRHISELPNWVLNLVSSATPVKTALVIGAGLAGAHCARNLAERGIKVTVLEKHKIGSGASSNFQGAVFTRLSASPDALSEFNLQAQVFSDQFYQRNHLYEKCGAQSGVLHLAHTQKEHKRLIDFAKTINDGSDDFIFVSPEQATALANICLSYPALFIKNSGWMHPKILCHTLLSHPNIHVIENENILALEQYPSEWHALSESTHYRGEVCIVANAGDALSFEQTAHLPLKKIRGQVTHVKATGDLSRLATVICGEGYLCPAAEVDGEYLHSIGATYNLENQSSEPNAKDHSKNLAALSEIFANQNSINDAVISSKYPGNVGFRTTTLDYFPIVGVAPKIKETTNAFSFLGKKANAKIDEYGASYSGLYCCLGFGSRGLAYTPLAAAIIGDLVSGSYLPVSRTLYSHLHPARFAIRALIKNKPYPH